MATTAHEPLLGGNLNTPKRPSLYHEASTKGKIWFFVLAALALGLRIATLCLLQNKEVVNISAVVKERKVTLIEFTLADNYFADTIDDLRSSGAYATMCITLFGTAIIPVGRIFVVVLCFIIPFPEHRHQTRGNILFFMDHVGRFILADSFIAGYSSTFFYTHKRFLHTEHGIGSIPHDIEVMLGTEYEFVYYLLLGSNILGSLLTHQLMIMSMPEMQLSGKDAGDKIPIFDRVYSKAAPFVLSKFTFIAAVALGVCALFDLLLLKSRIVSFTLSGVVGHLTGSDPKTFNIWTPVSGFVNTLRPTGDARDQLPYITSGAHVIVVIALPTVILLAGMVFALTPLNKRVQIDTLYYTPFWFSFCAIDVFLAVTLSLYFEMNILASYMFKNNYPQICDLLQGIFSMPCNSVETDFGRGIVSLFILLFSIYFVRFRMMRLYEELKQLESTERVPSLI